MAIDEIRFDGDVKLYLRVPQNLEEEEVVVHLRLPKNLAGKYLKMEVMDENDDVIPVRANCKEASCQSCGVIYCSVHYGNAQLRDVCEEPEEVDTRPTIPGHPNCHLGECWDCHVVSCGIQQGWEDIP